MWGLPGEEAATSMGAGEKRLPGRQRVRGAPGRPAQSRPPRQSLGEAVVMAHHRLVAAAGAGRRAEMDNGASSAAGDVMDGARFRSDAVPGVATDSGACARASAGAVRAPPGSQARGVLGKEEQGVGVCWGGLEMASWVRWPGDCTHHPPRGVLKADLCDVWRRMLGVRCRGVGGSQRCG